jgi:hypothetical protein
MLRIRIRDPVPFWPLDPGWVKNQDPRSGSGMNITDHISESFETIFWVKILKFCPELLLLLSRFLSALIFGPKESFSSRFCRVKMPTEFVSDITVPLWSEVF